MRDIPAANTELFPKLGEAIAGIGDQFRGAGWGFSTCTHYSKRVKFGDNQAEGAEWSPDIPGSSASAIAKPSDMMVQTTKLPTGAGRRPMFVATFVQERTNSFGCRVPIASSIPLPDYDAPTCPPDATMYAAVKAEYESACKKALAENEKFHEAVNNVAGK
jgi:hypothetical protein